MKTVLKLPSYLLIGLIFIYKKVISPWMMPACRYTPTCSEYAMEAIKKYGAFKGGWLAIKRISSCHPGAATGMTRCRRNQILVVGS